MLLILLWGPFVFVFLLIHLLPLSLFVCLKRMIEYIGVQWRTSMSIMEHSGVKLRTKIYLRLSTEWGGVRPEGEDSVFALFLEYF